MQHKKFKLIGIKELISLSNFSTWKVGGTAEWLGEPTNINELIELINWSKVKKITAFLVSVITAFLVSNCN